MTQMELAAKIKAAAKERGVKVSYVAEQVGLSKQQFSDMLHCRKIIRAEYMPNIAAAIGVAVETFYTG